MDGWDDIVERAFKAGEEQRKVEKEEKKTAHIAVFALAELFLSQIRDAAVTEREELAALDTARSILPLLELSTMIYRMD